MRPRSKRFKVWYLLTQQGWLEPVFMHRQDAGFLMLSSLSGPWWCLSHYHLGETQGNTSANLRSSASPGRAGRSSLGQQFVQPSLTRTIATFVSILAQLVFLREWKFQSKGQRNQLGNFPWFWRTSDLKDYFMVHFLSSPPPSSQHILSLSNYDNMVLAALDWPYSQFWEEAPNARCPGYI